jgi:ribosomal protein L15
MIETTKDSMLAKLKEKKIAPMLIDDRDKGGGEGKKGADQRSGEYHLVRSGKFPKFGKDKNCPLDKSFLITYNIIRMRIKSVKIPKVNNLEEVLNRREVDEII